MPALYRSTLKEFLDANPSELLGILTLNLASERFDSTVSNTFSWHREIEHLQLAFRQMSGLLPEAENWALLFEYVFPVTGQRIDCVMIARDLIFVIEYKSGSSVPAKTALRQAQDYALNLADFHEASRGRIIIPIAVGAFPTSIELDEASVSSGTAVTPSDLPSVVVRLFQGRTVTEAIEVDPWNRSRYFPVPGIIQAAAAIYENHDIRELAHSRAGADDLEATQSAIARAVAVARQSGKKKLVVVTGVPGAGKTLAGLNIVQRVTRQLNLENDQAAFLSGNGPLVKVLQHALKASAKRKGGKSRAVNALIREIHRFARDTYESERAPVARIIVFDEAQRAWTAARNNERFEVEKSEPDLLLAIMGRHNGWAVIVALVGGGQEIHSGEAGLSAWGEAITTHSEWSVEVSPEALHGGPAVAGSRLFTAVPEGVDLTVVPELHLNVSKRSYENDATAAWVNFVLQSRPAEASEIARKGIPILLTRDLGAARLWLRGTLKGHRRSGLVASSGAARARADGVETPTFQFLKGVDYVKWFLQPTGDFRSSNQLEVALSEFEMQGLELDTVGLVWGGDLVFPGNLATARRLKGTRWCTLPGTGDPQVSADDPRTRVLNKYRVLLTRFRKAMVIFVPRGTTDDDTRLSEDFDTVYSYLRACGAQLLNNSGSLPFPVPHVDTESA